MRRALLTLALVAAALAAGMGTIATAATPQTSFNDVENEVMCVSCGVPLAIAESPQADRERAEIRRLIAQGKSKQQVKDELVATYGRNVLALPDDKGFGLAAYLVPLAIAAGIIALLVVLLPRWRRRRDGQDSGFTPAAAAAAGAGAPALSDAEARRLDEDLARYDG
jgi:cytochrome c-type biogenesis protein CcmH